MGGGREGVGGGGVGGWGVGGGGGTNGGIHPQHVNATLCSLSVLHGKRCWPSTWCTGFGV